MSGLGLDLDLANMTTIREGRLRRCKMAGFGKAGLEGSDQETCYRISRAFHMLKTKPEKSDRLRDFIARCRNEDGGYGVAPGLPSNVGGCYYAGIILHWLDEK